MANTVLANLIVKIGADTKDVSAGLGRVETGMGRLRSEMTKTRSVTGLLAGAAGFGFAAKQAFDLGSAVEETASKFNTVFGESSESVQGFIDQFATMAGLSNEAAQGVLATTGSIVQGMGFAQEASANFSTQVVELAGDLSSFNNIPIGETALAIQAALTGEREQMKRLGIVLREADVQQRALAISGKSVASALTDQDRATATLQLITERAGFAVGDLERTQDSAANKARALGAELQNIKETLASSLLPVMSIAVEGFGKFIKGIQIMATEAAVLVAQMNFWKEAAFGTEESTMAANDVLRQMRIAAEKAKLEIVGLSFNLDGLTESTGRVAGNEGASGASLAFDNLGVRTAGLSVDFSQAATDGIFLATNLQAVGLAAGIAANEVDRLADATQKLSAISSAFSFLGRFAPALSFLSGPVGIAAAGLGAAGSIKTSFGSSSGTSSLNSSAPSAPSGGGTTLVQIVTQDGRALTDKIDVTQQRDSNLRRVMRVPVAAMAL